MKCFILYYFLPDWNEYSFTSPKRSARRSHRPPPCPRVSIQLYIISVYVWKIFYKMPLVSRRTNLTKTNDRTLVTQQKGWHIHFYRSFNLLLCGSGFYCLCCTVRYAFDLAKNLRLKYEQYFKRFALMVFHKGDKIYAIIFQNLILNCRCKLYIGSKRKYTMLLVVLNVNKQTATRVVKEVVPPNNSVLLRSHYLYVAFCYSDSWHGKTRVFLYLIV